MPGGLQPRNRVAIGAMTGRALVAIMAIDPGRRDLDQHLTGTGPWHWQILQAQDLGSAGGGYDDGFLFGGQGHMGARVVLHSSWWQDESSCSEWGE